MRLNIIILIISALCIKDAFAQPGFEKDLLAIEQKIFETQDDSVKADLHLQKIDLYLSASDYSSEALFEIKRVDHRFFRSRADRERFLWNASIVAKANDEFGMASHYYTYYMSSSSDSSIQSVLLNVLINNGSDSAALTRSVRSLAEKDKRFQCLTCLNEVVSYKRKNKNMYIAASALIPGLGSALNGNVYKGASSLLINSAMVYAICLMAQSNLYANAVLWGASAGLKFYTGNLKLTEKLFMEKEAKKRNMLAMNCKHNTEQLLNEFPVAFK